MNVSNTNNYTIHQKPQKAQIQPETEQPKLKDESLNDATIFDSKTQSHQLTDQFKNHDTEKIQDAIKMADTVESNKNNEFTQREKSVENFKTIQEEIRKQEGLKIYQQNIGLI